MNRYKFQIWDKEKKVWYEPVYKAYKGNLYELLLTTSGELCRRTMEGLEHESTFPDRYIVRQFTGLQDKNKKDIYKDDYYKRHNYLYKVIWDDEKCGFAGLCVARLTDFEPRTWQQFDSSGSPFVLLKQDDITEVIGNVYETELLNQAP
jgi:uncharacterized phage protein (TIGR01671 family)